MNFLPRILPASLKHFCKCELIEFIKIALHVRYSFVGSLRPEAEFELGLERITGGPQ